LLTFADKPSLMKSSPTTLPTYKPAGVQGRKGFDHTTTRSTLAWKMKQGQPEKAILLITDGEDTRSRYSLINVRNAVKESDVQIYAIGIKTLLLDFAQAAARHSRRDD
jgi:hypothetical protein